MKSKQFLSSINTAKNSKKIFHANNFLSELTNFAKVEVKLFSNISL